MLPTDPNPAPALPGATTLSVDPAISQPSPPVPTAADYDLLTHLLTSSEHPILVARSRGMSFPDFLAWEQRPEIQKAFADYRALERRLNLSLDASARRTLTATLLELLRTTTDDVERRRTGALLGRALNRPRPRRQSAPGSTSSSSSSSASSATSASSAISRSRVPRSPGAPHDRDSLEDHASSTSLSPTSSAGRGGRVCEAGEGQEPSLSAGPAQPTAPQQPSAPPTRPDVFSVYRNHPAPTSFYQASHYRLVGHARRCPPDLDQAIKPSSDLTHQQVVETCLAALKNNDHPVPDAGIKAIFNFCSPHHYFGAIHYDDFAAAFKLGPYQHLLNHDSATIPPQYLRMNGFGKDLTSTWYHVFVNKNGQEHQFEFGVARYALDPTGPLHLVNLEPPCTNRPFRPKPAPAPDPKPP